MFVIKPIKETEIQISVAYECGCEYIKGTLAYAAWELKDDGKTPDFPIGVCQFYPGENAEIFTLKPKDGCEEDEAMIILIRSVMSFLERAGSKSLFMPHSAGPDSLLKKCGLKKSEGGYTVDLTEFYKSPCKYNEANKNE